VWPLTLAFLTLLVLALPLTPALLEWRRQRDIGPLPIDGEHTLDVGAVAAGFRARLVAQPESPGQVGRATPELSLEPLVRVDGAFVPSPAEAAAGLCARTIVAAEAVQLPDDYAFARDIYGRRSIRTGQRNRLQGLLSDGAIVIAAGSELQRWAHASRVYVSESCRLLGPVAALQSIRLEAGCRFASVNAPVVRFGRAGDAAGIADGTAAGACAGAPAGELAPAEAKDGRWLVPQDFTFPANRLYRGDLVVHGNLWIGTGAHIAGSVKASGSIRLEAGAGIDGALIAGADISVERGCAIGGPVAAEREIRLAPSCVIGSPQRHTTVVAPVLRARVGATVHGAASALEHGRVEPDCDAATTKDHPCPP